LNCHDLHSSRWCPWCLLLFWSWVECPDGASFGLVFWTLSVRCLVAWRTDTRLGIALVLRKARIAAVCDGRRHPFPWSGRMASALLYEELPSSHLAPRHGRFCFAHAWPRPSGGGGMGGVFFSGPLMADLECRAERGFSGLSISRRRPAKKGGSRSAASRLVALVIP